MPTQATATPTRQNVLTDVVGFLTGLFPGVQVIKGLGNRTPMPSPATSGFIAVTAIAQRRLATNVDTYDTTEEAPIFVSAQQSVQLDLQIDCYGPTSGDWAAIISTLWRDAYACGQMQYSQPLHADEPRMIALTDAEQQYEERWSITAALQYNPVTTFTQDFADALEGTLIDVPVTYPDVS